MHRKHDTVVRLGKKHSLVELARELEGSVLTLLFLQHPGGRGGVKPRSHRKLSFYLLLLLCLPHSAAATLSLLSLWFLPNTLSRTHSHVSTVLSAGCSSQTGAQVCHRPDIHLARGEDRTDLFAALFLSPTFCPALPFHRGPDTL